MPLRPAGGRRGPGPAALETLCGDDASHRLTRMSNRRCDAVVVGSGPNGLAAAITLARAGRSVTVLEAQPTIGGGCRSAELTLPGFVHDHCSAIHPMSGISPFLQSIPLGH